MEHWRCYCYEVRQVVGWVGIPFLAVYGNDGWLVEIDKLDLALRLQVQPVGLVESCCHRIAALPTLTFDILPGLYQNKRTVLVSVSGVCGRPLDFWSVVDDSNRLDGPQWKCHGFPVCFGCD